MCFFTPGKPIDKVVQGDLSDVVLCIHEQPDEKFKQQEPRLLRDQNLDLAGS